MNKQTLGKFNQNASLKKGIIVCLLAAALLVSMVGMASADTQTWHLSSDDTTGGKMMYKGDQDGGTADVAIGAGNSVLWIANQSAEVNVSFPTGTNWTGILTKTDTTSQYYTVEIGVWNGTAFISEGSSYEHFIVNINWDAFAISATFTIPAGDYLALNVTPDTAMSIMTELKGLHSPGVSQVSSPSTDPGYPYPELPTIILMSAGLLALFSYVVYGRRRNNK